ncbi:MAG: hypothetical protein DME30_06765 [Verrucomicrobia bacterium]|nr:MAG: hypothetical protein DME30_06765 [Verrucomicrobiota bacterium]
MYRMPATSHIENGPDAQMHMTLTEKPSSEIVCLVDDDALVLRSTGLLLASDGFDVRRFDKGEDFIAYVASHKVPLVVLDIWMEEMTGLEILGRLCTISPQTHVIVITGHEDTAARILAMQIGTVAFLIKPFDDEQFLKAVHLALGHPDSKKKSAARAGASTLRVLVRHAFRYVKGFILPKWRRSLPNTL